MANRSDRRARLQQKIEHQINLEILLKHDELRLIEQELAKCQVSLEQLRRCNIIPFPGEQSSPITPTQMTTGTGAALRPLRNQHWPSSPAPWGVTDGPYARHYAQWLIPDGQFDSFPSTPTHAFGGKSVAGDARSTRNSHTDRASFNSSSRSQRAVGNINYQALAGIAPTPKDRHAPLVVQRQSDKQTVKLVCKFCNKENISSVQGFLNHCRIAHDKNYESHNAAVEDCGRPMEPGDAIPATTPTTEHPPSIVATPVATASAGRSLVHPLITGPRKVSNGAASASQSVVSTPVRTAAQHALPTNSSSAQPKPLLRNVDDGPFKPSPQAPRLSALMQKRGITGDLNKLVATAKERCDLDQIVSLVEDEASDEVETPSETSTSIQKTNLQGSVRMRLPAAQSTGKFAGQGPANEAPSTPAQAPDGLKIACGSVNPFVPQDMTYMGGSFQVQQHPKELEIPISPASMNDCALSPHTVDSNPGLLTDRDEDDDELDYDMHSDNDRNAEDIRVRVSQYGDDSEKMDMDEALEPCAPEQNQNTVPGQTLSNAKRGRGRPSKRGLTGSK